MSDLGVLNGGDTFSRAYGVNDSGVVVGQSIGSTSSPFYYSGGQMRFVGSLGGNYGIANKVNNAGQIVGISAGANGVTHAFRKSGTMTDLGSFPGGSNYSIASVPQLSLAAFFQPLDFHLQSADLLVKLFAESFHSRLRDEFLAVEVFESLIAARKLTAAWRDDYNHYRPHGSLGYVAPAVFAARCTASAPMLASATPQPTSPLQQCSGVTLTDTFITTGTGI